MSSDTPTWNRNLRFLFISTLIFQILIILTCVALEYPNTQAGLLKYRLPEFLFWAYLLVGIGAPVLALATLLFLWVKKSSLWNENCTQNKKALQHLVLLSIVNVCGFAVWFHFGGLVFFAAGGSR